MTYKLTVSDEWSSINSEDLWVYNKLYLSQVCGYTCGPAGLEVPSPGFYVVRPIINFMGMSRFSRIEYIKNTTEHLHPGEFWCEVFEGDHISIDFCNGVPDLIVKGFRDPQEPLYRWSKWEKVESTIPFPIVLDRVKDKYEWINCEFIGGKLIEAHFRRNPDFRFGNDYAVPVWDNEDVLYDNPNYIKEGDYHRKGFIIG